MTLKCDTKILDSLIRQTSKGDKGAAIGYFDDSGKHPRSGATAYEIAAINNFGAPESNIPERPWVTDGAFEGELPTNASMKRGVRKIHKGASTFHKEIREAAKIQKNYISAQLVLAQFQYARNAEATIESKGFNSPMFETGWLQKQIDIKYD